jgi:hypothetical protein
MKAIACSLATVFLVSCAHEARDTQAAKPTSRMGGLSAGAGGSHAPGGTGGGAGTLGASVDPARVPRSR